ncbi:hypothetical protein [Sphingosinicella sp. BN140058]|uniref:hypothetical protein n=1 Tax=Sphingosinicella sp. BN140058 TaxID=1892855 RepID=UPI00101076CD|nr:hypothetical protein [Sphingosinicella sp. BN140058]QAY77367.1 hypothetical protein ETR14_13280 [Sphingosinicella sp. BN140058]
MAQPPKTTPHSDLSGVHRDEKRNVDSANAVGQDAGTVADAKRGNAARPESNDEEPGLDDRSR